MLNIETVVCGALEENAYIVSKKGEAGAFLIDPGDDYASLCGRWRGAASRPSA